MNDQENTVEQNEKIQNLSTQETLENIQESVIEEAKSEPIKQQREQDTQKESIMDNIDSDQINQIQTQDQILQNSQEEIIQEIQCEQQILQSSLIEGQENTNLSIDQQESYSPELKQNAQGAFQDNQNLLKDEVIQVNQEKQIEYSKIHENQLQQPLSQISEEVNQIVQEQNQIVQETCNKDKEQIQTEENKNQIQSSQITQIPQNCQNLPQGIRGIIYSFFTFEDLVKKVSLISKNERNFIRKTELIDWKPIYQKLKTQYDELNYLRTLKLSINSKLKPDPAHPNRKKAQNHQQVEYLINLSQYIVISIDYWTINDIQTAIFAKYVLDKAIQMQKRIELKINVEKQIDCQKLVQILEKDGELERKIEALELEIGQFEFSDDDDEGEPQEQQANDQQNNDNNQVNNQDEVPNAVPVAQPEQQLAPDVNIQPVAEAVAQPEAQANPQPADNDSNEFESADDSSNHDDSDSNPDDSLTNTSSDSDLDHDSSIDDSEDENYLDKIAILINNFQHIDRLKITKHERYDGNLFIREDDIDEIQPNQLDRFEKFKNLNLQNFHYYVFTIEKYEIELLCKSFPNLKTIILEAENVLETKIDLQDLKNLEMINLKVLPSDDFEGEILDDEEVDEELKFKLLLNDEQICNIKTFQLDTTEFLSQDLYYLLEKIGQRLEFEKIKVYCGKIMINQKQNDLKNKYYIENLYHSLSGLAVEPQFNEISFKDGTCVYSLQKFTKNKKYYFFPIEVRYQRRLMERKIKKSITSSSLEIKNGEEAPLFQIFKIYAETCEIQLEF